MSDDKVQSHRSRYVCYVGILLTFFLNACTSSSPSFSNAESSPAPANTIIHIPTFAVVERDMLIPDAQLVGVLTLTPQGCLAVRTATNQTMLLIWPPDTVARTTQAGTIVVRDPNNRVEAVTGQRVMINGGPFGPRDQTAYPELMSSIEDRCVGDYWLASEVFPEERQIPIASPPPGAAETETLYATETAPQNTIVPGTIEHGTPGDSP